MSFGLKSTVQSKLLGWDWLTKKTLIGQAASLFIDNFIIVLIYTFHICVMTWSYHWKWYIAGRLHSRLSLTSTSIASHRRSQGCIHHNLLCDYWLLFVYRFDYLVYSILELFTSICWLFSLKSLLLPALRFFKSLLICTMPLSSRLLVISFISDPNFRFWGVSSCSTVSLCKGACAASV